MALFEDTGSAPINEEGFELNPVLLRRRYLEFTAAHTTYRYSRGINIYHPIKHPRSVGSLRSLSLIRITHQDRLFARQHLFHAMGPPSLDQPRGSRSQLHAFARFPHPEQNSSAAVSDTPTQGLLPTSSYHLQSRPDPSSVCSCSRGFDSRHVFRHPQNLKSSNGTSKTSLYTQHFHYTQRHDSLYSLHRAPGPKSHSFPWSWYPVPPPASMGLSNSLSALFLILTLFRSSVFPKSSAPSAAASAPTSGSSTVLFDNVLSIMRIILPAVHSSTAYSRSSKVLDSASTSITTTIFPGLQSPTAYISKTSGVITVPTRDFSGIVVTLLDRSITTVQASPALSGAGIEHCPVL